MIDIRKEDIEEYLGWIKILITICSASVATLLVKYDKVSPPGFWVKVSAVLFLLSLITLLVSYTGLVEHKRHDHNITKWRTAIFLFLGWFTFLTGFGALVMNLLSV
ncbi:hypothetical protein CYQ88_11040 [Hydrogenovibrio sp. SC-1]|uniref:hypothetical protein n=1 Tax=Hydrogenovibrio sp. SC-1 TaxID=2065820 RepID=UPI000C7C64CE|nr:hypothetical protein [Hydrogenovibrio sp. SC-1]PLA73465.1 hypothetical protein CYQ88_11040 [Hydrogenovibrio sp. SC-1]